MLINNKRKAQNGQVSKHSPFYSSYVQFRTLFCHSLLVAISNEYKTILHRLDASSNRLITHSLVIAFWERSIFLRMCWRYRIRLPMHTMIDKMVVISVTSLKLNSWRSQTIINKQQAATIGADALKQKKTKNNFFQNLRNMIGTSKFDSTQQARAAFQQRNPTVKLRVFSQLMQNTSDIL